MLVVVCDLPRDFVARDVTESERQKLQARMEDLQHQLAERLAIPLQRRINRKFFSGKCMQYTDARCQIRAQSALLTFSDIIISLLSQDDRLCFVPFRLQLLFILNFLCLLKKCFYILLFVVGVTLCWFAQHRWAFKHHSRKTRADERRS